ncbi:14424_t:CDS:2, partial [Racocetra persica]
KSGRQCLSTQYTTNKDLSLWCCSNNHEWYTSLGHIKYSKSWCPHCAKVARCTIKDARQIRCENNYIFTATLNAINNQHTWYPFCSKKCEDLYHKIITKYLGPPLPIRKPNFLKTPEYSTGLELDILYYDYGFAIEVQGIQYEYQIKFFHLNFEDFEKQQTRDQLKEELCEENWITLRYVWYYKDLFEKILVIFRELGLIP